MVTKKKFQALGRGLDALIDTSDSVQTSGSSSINEIALDKIAPNPDQPRREFDETALAELSESIKQLGIVQPLTVRLMDDGMYQIIAGERRWRASRMAGLKTVPAYVRTANDENMMQMALVENIQREDLNAIEVALAYQKLIEQYSLTQEELSEKVGKKRTTVANALRMLKLPASIQLALQNKQITPGHARAILGMPHTSQQIKLFQEVLKHDYSVRQVEERVQTLKNGIEEDENPKAPSAGKRLPTEYEELRSKLSHFFNAKVQMTMSKEGKGKISIPFGNEDELVKLIGLFDKIRD